MSKDATPFAVVRRGYDISEVDNHLRSLRRESQQGNEDLDTHVASLEAQLVDARKREEALLMTLVAATKTKEEALVAAQGELNEAADKARVSAESIVSEAQFEAFRLLTQAKEDAEATLEAAQAQAAGSSAGSHSSAALSEEEANRIRVEARAEAEALLEEMRIEALDTIREIREESEQIISARDANIASLRTEIVAMRERTTPAAMVNDQPQAKAGGALQELLANATEDAGTPDPILQPSAVPIASSEEEQSRQMADAASPRATGMTVDDTDALPLSDRPARGSFYSRRSARLPRIGTDAANGALAAVSAMRSKGRDTSLEDDEGVPLNPEEDMAMQTA